MSGGTWAGRGERAALALVAPARSKGPRHVGTWHAGPSVLSSGPSSAKGPSPGWPRAPLCLSGSKLASQFKTKCSHLRVRALTCAGVDFELSERRQNLPRGNSSFPGLSHGSPRSSGLPHASPRGLLLTGAGAFSAAGSSQRSTLAPSTPAGAGWGAEG